MGEIAMASIVLADDDEDLRAVYAPCLRSAGHTVREAAGGLEALELVREHRPGLLILDVWMPRWNGFEVLEALRHDPASNALKVLMLSNLGDADTRLECFAMGASEYLVKGLPWPSSWPRSANCSPGRRTRPSTGSPSPCLLLLDPEPASPRPCGRFDSARPRRRHARRLSG